MKRGHNRTFCRISSACSKAFCSLLSAWLMCSPTAQAEIAAITRANTAAIPASSFDGTSTPHGITPDGRYVLFSSEATNTVSGDTNRVEDVFLMDSGVNPPATTRVSVSSSGEESNGASLSAAVSDDGHFVVFTSNASNLVPNDTNAVTDVFLHNTQTHQTSRISVDKNGAQLPTPSGFAKISGNGRFVAFTNASTVLNDNNGTAQIYVRDLEAGPDAVVRASAIDADGSNSAGNQAAQYPSLSFDGSIIAFNSTATNLIAGGTAAGVDNVYVRNLNPASRQTLLVSRRSGAAGAVGNGPSWGASLSSDGTRVSYISQASNLVDGDSGGLRDVFVRDLTAETTARVSLSSGQVAANAHSTIAALSPDGNFVTFNSTASNLAAGDSNGFADVFLRDIQGATTERISVSSEGNQAEGEVWLNTGAISSSGAKVLFYSTAKNLVPGDTSNLADLEIFVRDTQAEITSRITETVPRYEAEGTSASPSISADGKLVAFASDARNIINAPYYDDVEIFVRNRDTATTVLISHGLGGVPGNSDSSNPVISANGRYVAFQSLASNLVANDNNHVTDIFVYDLQQQTMTRASAVAGSGDSDAASDTPSLSATGRYVGFFSLAESLVAGLSMDPGNSYVYDQQTGETSIVSVDADGRSGDGFSYTPLVSSDALYAVFASVATNFVANDTNSAKDLFLKHLTGDLSLERLSVKTGGAQIATGITGPFSISPDARYAAFESTDAAIVASDSNGDSDIFLRDRNSGTTICISRAASGGTGNGGSYNPSFTPDGLYVTFHSYASNLVPGDTNGRTDAFVYSIASGTLERVSITAAGVQANDDAELATAANNRAFIAFASYASNLVADDLNGQRDIFVATYDFCPADPMKVELGICGCGTADTDTDGDGTADCHDSCPADAAKTAGGICGCGTPDTDSDHDGTPDCHDQCSSDPAKQAAGVCGCGMADTDSDTDDTADCHDGCPADQKKISSGICGCGAVDADLNGNSQADCLDPAAGLVPAIATVKIRKNLATFTLQAFNNVQYLVKLTRPNGSALNKKYTKNTFQLKSLPRGSYTISYRIKAGSLTTPFSKKKKFRV